MIDFPVDLPTCLLSETQDQLYESFMTWLAAVPPPLGQVVEFSATSTSEGAVVSTRKQEVLRENK